MPQLPLSGPLSIEEIAEEFFGSGTDPSATPPHWLADYYGVDDDPAIPTSGTISISDFYGAQNLWELNLGDILVGNNIQNLNVYDLAIANGWNGQALIDITIPAGVYIWSDDIALPGLITGNLPNGLILRNYGYIIGKGGQGGSVTNATTSAEYIEAEDGGPAMVIECETELYTHDGYVAAGGGGGGGIIDNPSGYVIIGGGGGGAGGGQGGNCANIRHGENFPGGAGGAVGAMGSIGQFHGMSYSGGFFQGGNLFDKGQSGGSGGAAAEAGGGGGTMAHDGVNKGHNGHASGNGGGRILPGTSNVGFQGSLANGNYRVYGGSGGGASNDGDDAYSDTRPSNQVIAAGGGGGWGAAGGEGRRFSVIGQGGNGGYSIVKNGYNLIISGSTSQIWGAMI